MSVKLNVIAKFIVDYVNSIPVTNQVKQTTLYVWVSFERYAGKRFSESSDKWTLTVPVISSGYGRCPRMG